MTGSAAVRGLPLTRSHTSNPLTSGRLTAERRDGSARSPGRSASGRARSRPPCASRWPGRRRRDRRTGRRSSSRNLRLSAPISLPLRDRAVTDQPAQFGSDPLVLRRGRVIHRDGRELPRQPSRDVISPVGDHQCHSGQDGGDSVPASAAASRPGGAGPRPGRARRAATARPRPGHDGPARAAQRRRPGRRERWAGTTARLPRGIDPRTSQRRLRSPGASGLPQGFDDGWTRNRRAGHHPAEGEPTAPPPPVRPAPTAPSQGCVGWGTGSARTPRRHQADDYGHQ